ncbi:hypothetical protein [Streptomyces sp. NBC_01268]|uniref:hypothetical protein n=1 Tax=Streptomyces sp. NBC_01268 TaxID=2903806 RepID=UPI002E3727A0|nr:hypothetical protein [Streptomyces sp. NBC_01268]
MTNLHATRAETISALMASIQEYRALQQPLVDALRRIRDDMDRASKSGDEWAMEWLGDVWNDLPLAARAAGGDQDAAKELAATVRDAARQAAGQPAADERTCTCRFDPSAEKNHRPWCAIWPYGSPAAGLAAPTNHNTEQQALDALLAAFIGRQYGKQEALRLAAAYRAAILNSAADEIAAVDFHPNAKAQCLDVAQGFARRLRRLAAGAES